VLGGGAMGSALVPALRRANLRVSTAWSRNPHPGPWRSGPLPRALREAELVLLAVADGAVAQLCAQLVDERLIIPGQLVVHLAGGLPVSVLDPAVRAGARTGSMHPLRAVMPSPPPDALKGATASIAGSDEIALSQVAALSHALGMVPLPVSDSHRPLYHAAAVLAGGAQVALFAEAVRAFQAATGTTEEEARAALLPLAQGALLALQGRTPAAAVTGPVLRGDAATVVAHRVALQAVDPQLRALYETLSHASLRLAREGQRASDEALALVSAALSGPLLPVGPQPAAARAEPPRMPSSPLAEAPGSRSSRPRHPPPKAARPAASSRSPAPHGRPPSPPPRGPAPRKRR
jgi:predicted short-subunit dehydrogenase-like oxidoreductase (DUF2520 family)